MAEEADRSLLSSLPEQNAHPDAGPERESFFAEFISGAHPTPDGNAFVTDGPHGWFFEVTPAGERVWEYRNPHTGDAPNPAGDPLSSTTGTARFVVR